MVAHRDGWAFIAKVDANLARCIRRAQNRNEYDTPAFLAPDQFENLLALLSESGVDTSELGDLAACFEAYKNTTAYCSAKRNPRFILTYAPSLSTIDTFIQQSGVADDLTSSVIRDDEAFNAFLESRIRKHIYGDSPALAIKHAYSAAVVMQRGFRQLAAIHGEDMYWRRMSYISRVGGWAAQQSGQWAWLARFKGFVEQAASSGNLDAIATESLLLFHWQKRERDHVRGVNLAGRALAAIDAMRHQHLWSKNRSSVVENAVTEQLAAGKRLSDEFCQSGKSLGFHLNSIIEMPASTASQVNNKLFQYFALAKASAQEGDMRLAGDSLTKAESLLSRNPAASNAYARSLYRLAAGYYEKRNGSQNAGIHLEEALRLSLTMGAVHRARRAMDWAVTSHT